MSDLIDWSNRECSRCGDDVWQARISERGWCEDCEVFDTRTAAAVAQGAEFVDRVWMEWLRDIGYGVDFTCTPPPPCEPAALAELYAETDGESVEDWTDLLLDGNTSGGWYGNGKDAP